MTRPSKAPAEQFDQAAIPDKRGRILIVDDRPDKLITLQATLETLGHEIVTAGSGANALRCLLEQDMAVVLLDVNMPGMDGFETARLIRSRRRNFETPIIFITAYGDELHALRGYTLGAVDFILAPVVPELLRSKVSVFLELFERAGQVREHARRLLHQTQQLQLLTRYSLVIHSKSTVEQILQTVADAAREIVGSRSASVMMTINQSGLREKKLLFSTQRRTSPVSIRPHSVDLSELGIEPSRCRRVPADELMTPAWSALLPADASREPTGGLASPIVSRDGAVLGVLLASGRDPAEFCDDDEALLIQLAQIAATAVENTLFAEAREMNRVKDEFLATLSHELRTPLSSILGWAQLLQTGLLDTDETVEAVGIIERNADMQSKLIEDLLDVSRIITGKMQLTIRPVRLAQVLESAVDVVLPAARAKGIEIQTLLEDVPDRILGDADRLQQVFWNLLSNAVKFTAGPGRIELRAEMHDEQIEVVIQDEGEGIDPAFLPHVFDRFRQADSSTSRMHGGLGIGLAIVRHVVELHGGLVSADSPGRGLGTTFTVSLPLASGDEEVRADTGSSLEAARDLAPVPADSQ